MIDYLPSVIAFAEARINQLAVPSPETEARIDELKMIITLCRGLSEQNKMMEALPLRAYLQRKRLLIGQQKSTNSKDF